MANEELTHNLSKLIRTINDKRVLSEGEMNTLLQAIIGILAENKKGVDTLNADTRQQLENALSYLGNEHKTLIDSIQGNLSMTRSEIEKATKEQNDRAFKRLQELLSKVKIPKDGKDGKNGLDGIDGKQGKDGSPDSPVEIVSKLESLEGEDRLDASAIKNLPKWVVEKGKKMLVGGIRFLENLADVSIVVTKKRQDLLIQYNTTNNRWQDGIAFTVSTTAPTNPQINDCWLDIS